MTDNGDGTKDIGFVTDELTAEKYSSFNTILASFGGTVMGYPFKNAFPTVITGATISLGIIIENIPANIENVQIKLTSQPME